MPEPVSDDTAQRRWMVIQLLRVGGVAAVILGILMARDVVVMSEDDNLVAYVFIAVGLLDVFLVPRYLARKWRTPRG